MLKDHSGNELKVGDKVLLNVSGLMIGTIGHVEDGGLSVIAPGTRHGHTELPGNAVIEIDIPMQFDPKKNTTLFKYVPNDIAEQDKNGKPN